MVMLAASSAAAAEFSGQFYEKGSKRTKLLFTNKSRFEVDGASKLQRVTFTDPAGKDLVVEETTWQDGALKKYAITQHQLGESGLIEVGTDKVVFHYTKEGKTKTNEEPRTANFVVPGDLTDYVEAHWATILKGEPVEVRYAVPDRLETIAFTFTKASDVKIDGRDYVVVIMAAKSFFIRLVAKPVSFTFNPNGVGILSVDGRTSPKVKQGSGWADCDADAVFSAP